MERQNRSLVKCLKIAQLEGNNWQKELYEYLVEYRSTPHSSTGTTPAYLMLKREIKTKLSELRPDKNVQDEQIREKHWERSLSGKVYADSKRGAISSNIKLGKEVLLKNTKVTGKLAPNFEPTPYTVKNKEGSQLTIVSKDGVEYKRNSSFVKPFHREL